MVMQIPKITALMPLWGRPEIAQLAINALPWWVHSIVFVASREDPHHADLLYNSHKAIPHHVKGVAFLEAPNHPLGAKHNVGVEAILEEFNSDYLLNIGSDNIIHESLLETYFEKLGGVWPTNSIIGLGGCDWYEPSTHKAASIHYGEVPVIMGAGRLVHRDILIRCDGELYSPSAERGLDTNSQFNAMRLGDIRTYKFDITHMVLDIKTALNINPFSQLEEGNIAHAELPEQFIIDRYGIGGYSV